MQRTNGKLGIRVLRTRGRNYHFREISAVPIRIQIVSHREAVFAMPHAEPWFPKSFFWIIFSCENLWWADFWETMKSVRWLLSRFWRNLCWQKLLEAKRKSLEILHAKKCNSYCSLLQTVCNLFAISNWLKVIIWKIISEVWDFHLQKQNRTDPIANFPVLLPVSQTPYKYVEFRDKKLS